MSNAIGRTFSKQNMRKRKIRVLFVSPLTSSVVGGIVKWTKNILDYYRQVKLNSDVELLPCYNDGIINELNGSRILGRVRNGIVNYLPLIRKVRHELDQSKVDVVHICSSASVGLIKDLVLMHLAKNNGAKTVVHFHFGRMPVLFNKCNWEQRLIKKVISSADTVVVMDMASYNTLAKYGYKHVCYIPNPLSLDTRICIEKYKDRIKRIAGKVVFVGQMLATKGIFELAEAINRIEGVKVYFIGPIPNADVTARLHTLLSADKLVLCGSMSFEKVIQEMLSASVFVLPTYTEGFPNVIIESMACACPIVTTPVGAIPEMLNIRDEKYKCGICVPVKDVRNLENAIREMLDNRAQAMKMGQMACERVNGEYSIQRVWSLLQDTWLTS